MEVLKHLPETNSGRRKPGITREEAFAMLQRVVAVRVFKKELRCRVGIWNI